MNVKIPKIKLKMALINFQNKKNKPNVNPKNIPVIIISNFYLLFTIII